MDGNGYPRGLRGDQMSVQARMMAIADIFEALTAKDRPYKKGKTLTESLQILGGFRQRNHIDPDLFDVFIRQKVYLQYARRFMDPAQIDEVDESKIPGYVR
jgi:HD-GYP domain-containing protein (c-di-GMP phosphodiesterase class II)